MEHVSIWLTGTVPGIICLGAVGSLLAMAVWYLGRKVLTEFGPKWLRRYLDRRNQRWLSAGYVLGFLSGARDTHWMSLYLSYRLAGIVKNSVVALSALILFAVMVNRPEEPLLSVASYGTVVVWWLHLFAAAREAWRMRREFRFIWEDFIRASHSLPEDF